MDSILDFPPYFSEYEVEYLWDSADLNEWASFPHGISVLNTEEIKLFPVQHFIVKLWQIFFFLYNKCSPRFKEHRLLETLV